MMKTIVYFRQGGNNLRLGNTLVWIENAINWCQKNDFIFCFPNAKKILGELFDFSEDFSTMPPSWDKSIFYEDEKIYTLMGRIVATVNEVKSKGSVSDFTFACSILPEIIAYIDPERDTDWSNVPMQLISFLKDHKLVIVNDPYPFKMSSFLKNKSFCLQPSKQSTEFTNRLLNKTEQKIALHIRQGDYKSWQGGKYYKNSQFYNELIEAILNRFCSQEITLLVAHDGEFKPSKLNKNLLLENETIFSNHTFSGVAKDFLVLSSCDLVIGPLSTFSRQALMWGKKYNDTSGTWLPIDSKSNISDILDHIEFYISSAKNNTSVTMQNKTSDSGLKTMIQCEQKVTQKEIKSNSKNPEFLDLIVCSYGGAGTTFFMQFLEKYKKVNSPVNKDGLKHIDKPPIRTNISNFKALYMFGNPLNAIISLFQRDYQSPHSHKLLVNYPDIKPISRNCTLEEYLEEGVDRFKLEQHFYNWINAKSNYQIMLIKYEKMWENLEQIFEFLEIPFSDIEQLKKIRKVRKSNLHNLSSTTQKKLYYMYGEFAEKVAEFDDIKIINPVP